MSKDGIGFQVKEGHQYKNVAILCKIKNLTKPIWRFLMVSTTSRFSPKISKNSLDEKQWLELLEKVKGQWAHIYLELAPQLESAMAAAPEHGPCPVHGGFDGFRFFHHYMDTGRGVCNTCGAFSSGFKLLAWANNWPFNKAVQEVQDWVSKQEGKQPQKLKLEPPAKVKIDPEKAYKNISALWKSSKDLKGTLGEMYLNKRGIRSEDHPPFLRFHPEVDYYQKNKQTKKLEFLGKFPAILCPVKNSEGVVVTLHRIYLSDKGEKLFKDNPELDSKKIMSYWKEINGSCARLYPLKGSKILGVSEGIETACAAHAISKMPVWAGITAVLMEQMEIPSEIETVVIWADKDISQRGEVAANTLAESLEKKGLKVEVYFPFLDIKEGEKGVDWLDVLNIQGVNGFPAKWRKWRPSS